MSKLTQYIEAHTAFLNVLLPTLNNLVQESPIPASIKADFTAVYSLAPALIGLGAAAVAEATGKEQPALNDLAFAFQGGPVVPAPAPVVAPIVAAPPASVTIAPVAPGVGPSGTSAAVAGLPTVSSAPGVPVAGAAASLTATVTGAAAAPPAPATTTPALPGVQNYDPAEIAKLAQSLGLVVLDPMGNRVAAGD